MEDLLAERGLDISYESVRRWFLKFGAPIAQNLRHMRPIPNGYWHLDEMVIVIRGQRYWLWRAIDNGGEVLDFLVQSKRNAKAALKLMRKLLKKQGWTPPRVHNPHRVPSTPESFFLTTARSALDADRFSDGRPLRAGMFIQDETPAESPLGLMMIRMALAHTEELLDRRAVEVSGCHGNAGR